MTTIIKKIIFLSLLTLYIVFSPSCKKEWNSHYKDNQTGASTINIMEYIHSQSSLSKFEAMLVLSGYNEVLDKSQNYTVWAPDNNALEGIDLTDTSEVKDIVENHITTLSCPTSIIRLSHRYIKMVNNKFILFSKENSTLEFGKKVLTSSDMLTANGIVHIIGGYVPFQPTIYEYIQRNSNFSLFYSYIKSLWDSTYLPSSGYDSTYAYTNKFFQELGNLDQDLEDSSYTAILPTDAAWTSAYSRIKQYFVSAHKTKALQIQDEYTEMVLVKDLVFKNRIYDPFSYDSLVSTYGTVFKSPGYLFNNTQLQELSNGLVYVTDTLHYKATEGWAKAIKVEAESTTGRLPRNASLLTRYSYGTNFRVSQSRYILVDPTTTSTFSKVNVDFQIPNTLSAKYNIYCVFVPASIEYPTDLRPFRASFYITYLGNNGSDMVKQQLTVTNNTTNPNDTTKMKIASNFKFPFSHISSEELSTQVVTLTVQNEVVVTEEDNYSRSMRIDCIILEPTGE